MTLRAVTALLVAAALLGAAAAAAEPRLVRVDLTAAGPGSLLESGLDVIELRPGRFALVLSWPGDQAALHRLGLPHQVVDEAPGRTLARRAALERAGRPRPAGRRVMSPGRDGRLRPHRLPPFGAGSVGGFWSLAEVRLKLDDLVASDVHGVVADRLDTIGISRAGRPILALELGTPVAGPDPRPVVLIAAMNHAREPIGMQAVFRFADDLLAGYGTDPFRTYLLEHRRIVLLPVKNPDGYWVNDSIFTSSGGTTYGFWRKNTRDNNGNLALDGQDGVDLNRNYSYRFGYNNTGSSPNPSSQTYRGPAAFSEPETEAHRDAVVALQPATAISFHCHGDYLLHPWGWTVPGTPDSAAFQEWSDEMAINGYQAGPAPRVLYEVNGEFNDWCYGEVLDKPKLFSWTPEIGSSADGFWPPPSRIVPLAEENLRTCYTVAAIAGPYVRVERATLVEGALNAGHVARLAVRARNLGLAAAPPSLAATLAPLDAGITVLSGPVAYPELASRSSGDAVGGATFTIAAFDTVTPGRLLRLLAEFTAPGGYHSRDTVELLAGTPTVVLAEDASGTLAAWSAQSPWGIVNGEPAHPGRFITDSPAGRYAQNANTRLTHRAPLDLSTGVHAWATFEARWTIETDYDALIVEASLDSATWTPLHGTVTVPGLAGVQPAGQPVYEGTRTLWTPERVDLSPFTGPSASRVWLRLRLAADGGTHLDGFALDSLRVLRFDPGAQPPPVAVGERGAARAALAAPRPLPARVATTFDVTLAAPGPSRLEIVDLAGRRVAVLADRVLAAGTHPVRWDLRDDAGRRVAPGLYFARLVTVAGAAATRVPVLD